MYGAAEDPNATKKMVIYAKLPKEPKGFYIPTPVSNHSPN
jgi:type III restriction enzyme